jgi:kinetochore protein Spc7/SPC105
VFTESRLPVYLGGPVPSNITSAPHRDIAPTMANAGGKENIADGLIANASFNATTSFNAPALSPKKASRKTRSKSIGPGGLGDLEAPALKESSGNRRKSAFIPAVKSILSSNDEDEKKRKEARRKSLGALRVYGRRCEDC